MNNKWLSIGISGIKQKVEEISYDQHSSAESLSMKSMGKALPVLPSKKCHNEVSNVCR